jgi:ubiquinone/menaquinone biosynthesis C-methylase UbiE
MVRQSGDRVRGDRAHDKAAPAFDRDRPLPDAVAQGIRSTILSAIATTGRPHILDIGAGSGRVGRMFVAQGDNYVGLDRSTGMLRAFMRRADMGDHHAPRLVQADGLQLPFPDAAFDAVLLMQVLSGACDRRGIVAEAGRVLRRNGQLIVGRMIAPDDGIDALMKRRLAELLEPANRDECFPRQADEDLRWLADSGCDRYVVTAATWNADRTPRGFLTRHATGARFSRLPRPVGAAAMLRLHHWALERFGSLDTVSCEIFRYELTICYLSGDFRTG